MIVELEEAKQKIAGLFSDVKELKDALGIDKLTERAKELEDVTCEGGFWSRDDAQKVMSELNSAKAAVAKYNELADSLEALKELVDMAI